MDKVSRGPVLIGERGRALSAEGSVLPKLVYRISQADPRALESVAAAGLPNPEIEIPEKLQKVFQRVARIAQLLTLTGESAKPFRSEVLDQTTLLMVEMCAISEYVRDFAHAILPSSEIKRINSCKKRMDGEIEALFRAPINTIKHKHFKFNWLEAHPPFGEFQVVKGFVLAGSMGPTTTGPASRVFGNSSFPDGYSFSLLLRRAICAPYAIFDAVYDLVVRVLLPFESNCVVARRDNQKLVEQAKDALRYVSALPRMGFPGENKHRVQELVLDVRAIAPI